MSYKSKVSLIPFYSPNVHLFSLHTSIISSCLPTIFG